jgi:hypothetical protein
MSREPTLLLLAGLLAVSIAIIGYAVTEQRVDKSYTVEQVEPPAPSN